MSRTSSSILLLLLIARPILAQTQPLDFVHEAQNYVERQIAQPELESDVLPAATAAVSLHADSDAKTVTLFLGHDIANGYYGWHIKLTAPIDEGSDRTEIVNRRGFPKQPTFSLGLSATNRPSVVRDRVAKALAGATARIAAEPEARVGKSKDQKDRFIEAVLRDQPALENVKLEDLAGQRSFKDANAAPSAQTTFVRYADVSASLGRKAHKFADAVDLSTNSVTRTNVEIAASVGLFPLSSSYLLAATLSRSSSYKDADKFDLCSPAGSDPFEKCESLSVGSPSHEHETLADVELRKLITPSIGLNPHLIRNFTTNVTSVELPVYFIRTTPDKKNASTLNGGIGAGWDSKTHNFTIGIFIGSMADIDVPFAQ